MYMDSVCLVGHTEIAGKREIIKKKLLTVLNFLIDNGFTEFYLGGANDWETICAITILGLKETNQNIHLNYVLPYKNEIYTCKWSQSKRRMLLEFIGKADSVEYVSERRGRHCLMRRDARLVELGDVCVCYYDERRRIRPTERIMKMVMEKGIYIFNVFEKDI